MRIGSVISLLLLLGGSVSTRALAQGAAGTGSRNSHPVITNLSVADQADSVAVEVTFTKVVHAEVRFAEHPDRLIFDFADCELAHPGQRLAVNRGPIVAVRASEFSAAPLISRVVIDLKSSPAESKQDHEETYVGNKLIIRLKIKTKLAVGMPGTSNEARHIAPAAEAAPTRPESAPSTPIQIEKTGATRSDAEGTPVIDQLHAYALLDKARGLTVSDLDGLEAKAKAGDPESETTLALAYHAGTLLKQDDREGLRLLQRAASRGFVAAEEAMGIFCQSGFGMPPDKVQAVTWYTKAAQHGSKDAATNLALMYSTGDGVTKDAVRAATWFHRAAEAGDATAQLNLAALYHRGEGLAQDDREATVWLTKAAEQGSLPAMLELARWDLQAGHDANVEDAIVWLKKAGDMGDATAQVELGDIFVDKKLGRVDYSQAVLWYRKAAEQGQREAEFGLGARYFLGQGVPQDLQEARVWLTPAAERGHPYAQFLLAKLYEAGGGGPVDVAAAARYYEPSADFGIAEAQYRLGLLLAADHGNGANLRSAYKWLVLAEDGVKESGETAEEIRKLLTPAQIAEVEHEIDEWRMAHRSRPASR